MKITKRQLKRIIKEEKQKLIKETYEMSEAGSVEGIVEAAVEGYQTGSFRNGAQIVSFVRQECAKLSLEHKFDQIISQVINSMLEF